MDPSSTCRKCHRHDGVCCNCRAHGGPLPLHLASPQTQKAIGVKALTNLGFSVPEARLVASDADMQALLDEELTPQFARPCPPTPRPGFVDSRICKTPKAVAKVWREARKADPQAELLLMPPIDKPKWNLVLTPGLLTIGPGHDGATAGKDAWGIGLVGEDSKLKSAHASLHIAKGEVPHVEVVIGQGTNPYYPASQQPDTIWWTQCRSGPAHPGGGPDYVPVDLTVAHVVLPCDDFLEWEAKVKAGFAPGTVVYGKGHTLGSHAALHCLAHGVPFVTSAEPQVGQTLKATPALPSYQLADLKAGLHAGWHADLRQNSPGDIHVILYALHNAPALRGADTWWIGLACSLIMRFGMQALDQELHIHHSDLVRWKGTGGGCQCEHCLPPGTKFTAVNWLMPHIDPQEFIKQIKVCRRTFHADMNTSGIGGHKWAWCGQALIPLAQAMQAAILANDDADPEATTQACIMALNSAVSQAHNGGFWMNKFGCHEGDFLEACQGSWKLWADTALDLIRWNKRRHVDHQQAASAWAFTEIDTDAGFAIQTAKQDSGGIVLKLLGRDTPYRIPASTGTPQPRTLDITELKTDTAIQYHFSADGTIVGSLHIDLVRPATDAFAQKVVAAKKG